MVNTVLAHGPEEKSGETAMAARADHEQLGTLGRIQQRRCRVVVHEHSTDITRRRIVGHDGRDGAIDEVASRFLER